MKTPLIRSILVTVNTDHSTHVALDKAEGLAKHTDAQLHLLTSTYDSITQYSDFLSEPQYLQIQDHLVTSQETLLTDIANSITEKGIKSTAHVRFMPNIADALDDLTQSLEVDLVIKRRSEELTQFNPFYTPTDRQCIRHSHQPLWLVSDEDMSYDTVIVAIDPITADPDHQRLNARIVKYSQWLIEHFDSKVIYINAYEPPVQTVGFEMAAIAYDDLLDNVAKHHHDAMERFAQQYGIDMEDCVVAMGEPAKVISQACATNQAELLLIGTVGRSGLSGFFLGNTAEDVLASVHCEVLCIPAQK